MSKPKRAESQAQSGGRKLRRERPAAKRKTTGRDMTIEEKLMEAVTTSLVNESNSGSTARKDPPVPQEEADESEMQEVPVQEKEVEQGLSSRKAVGDNLAEIKKGMPQIIQEIMEQIDTAMTMKEALETDLKALRKKLHQETATRTELEERVRLLAPEAALTDQLRQEVAFLNQERNRIFTELTEAKTQLEEVAEDRNSLDEKVADLDEQNRQIRQAKSALEGQVWSTKEKEIDLIRRCDQLGKERDALESRVHELTQRSRASESLARTLKQNLGANVEVVRDLRSEVETLQPELAITRADLTQALEQLHEHMESNQLHQSRLETLTEKHEAVSAELGTAREALRGLNEVSLDLRKRIKKGHPSN